MPAIMICRRALVVLFAWALAGQAARAGVQSSGEEGVKKATGSTAYGGLVFQINNTEPGISVSNITLYQANVSVNNPDQNVIFQYNATNASQSPQF
jgi:hypothetical protein